MTPLELELEGHPGSCAAYARGRQAPVPSRAAASRLAS